MCFSSIINYFFDYFIYFRLTSSFFFVSFSISIPTSSSSILLLFKPFHFGLYPSYAVENTTLPYNRELQVKYVVAHQLRPLGESIGHGT